MEDRRGSCASVTAAGSSRGLAIVGGAEPWIAGEAVRRASWDVGETLILVSRSSFRGTRASSEPVCRRIHCQAAPLARSLRANVRSYRRKVLLCVADTLLGAGEAAMTTALGLTRARTGSVGQMLLGDREA